MAEGTCLGAILLYHDHATPGGGAPEWHVTAWCPSVTDAVLVAGGMSWRGVMRALRVVRISSVQHSTVLTRVRPGYPTPRPLRQEDYERVSASSLGLMKAFHDL